MDAQQVPVLSSCGGNWSFFKFSSSCHWVFAAVGCCITSHPGWDKTSVQAWSYDWWNYTTQKVVNNYASVDATISCARWHLRKLFLSLHRLRRWAFCWIPLGRRVFLIWTRIRRRQEPNAENLQLYVIALIALRSGHPLLRAATPLPSPASYALTSCRPIIVCRLPSYLEA